MLINLSYHLKQSAKEEYYANKRLEELKESFETIYPDIYQNYSIHRYANFNPHLFFVSNDKLKTSKHLILLDDNIFYVVDKLIENNIHMFTQAEVGQKLVQKSDMDNVLKKLGGI